ncbi:hypothetical protein IWW54_004632 [Coemansia sp. RSA 2705]|nr:hypothetical protein IWW54_004632 [Coemansia sp. RSA 2705]
MLRALLTVLVLLVLGALATDESPAAIETLEVFDDCAQSAYVRRGEIRVHGDGTAQYHKGDGTAQAHGGAELDEPQPQPGADACAVVVRAGDGRRFVQTVARSRLGGDETFVVHVGDGVVRVDYGADKHGAGASRVVVRRRAAGPEPRLGRAAAVDAAGRERQAEAPKSFLAKYWYYIVPLVLILLLGGEEPKEGGGAQR